MRVFLTILLAMVGLAVAYASDFHNDDEQHRITYVITDNSGNPVSGQTVRIAIQRVSDDAFIDFNDGIFKTSGWTTRLGTMNYHTQGEYYQRTVSIDQATRISNDYCVIISNDDSVYADQQVEVFSVSDLKNEVKIHR